MTVTSPSVYVIVLNWRGWRDTVACVESLLRQEYPCEVVIVDNGSGDDSERRLRAAFPQLTVLQTGANLGYAGGNNAGIRYALAQGAQYLCLLNNDVTLPADAFGGLVQVLAAAQDLGAVSPCFWRYPDRRVVWCSGTAFHPYNGKPHHLHLPPEQLPQQPFLEMPYLPGTCLLVKRAVFEQRGLLPEQFFLYFEDVDWSLTVRQAGWKLGFVPRVWAIHPSAQSTARIRTLIPYYFSRNFLLFLRHHPEICPDVREARRLHLRACAKEMLEYLQQRRFAAISATLKGLFDAYTRREGRRTPNFVLTLPRLRY